MIPSSLWKIWGQLVKVTSIIGSVGLAMGVFLNSLVVWLNHGFMPVSNTLCKSFPGLVLDETHVCAGPETHLFILSDYIHKGSWTYSPGDLLMFGSGTVSLTAGICVLLTVACTLSVKLIGWTRRGWKIVFTNN